MARSCEVQAGDTGAVVVRRGTGAEDAAHLRGTAARLLAAAHPGVVEVLRSEGTEDSWELELVYGGRPLEAAARLTVEQVASVTASLAATVADLHAAGVVHGAIDASHVLVGGHGRPVLCGFGPRGPQATTADDVAAIGELIVALVGSDTELAQIPERRWLRPRSWRGGDGWERRGLLLVADHACAEPPSRRPSAARLAAAIAEIAPLASASTSASTSASSLSGSAGLVAPGPEVEAPAQGTTGLGSRLPALASLPSLAAAAVAVIVLAVMALALIVPAMGGRTVSSSSPHLSESAPTPGFPTTASTTTTSVAIPRATGSPSSSASDLEIATVVEGGRRYEVGDPGDVVVLGDWDGDGQRTAAVLRPSTGEVFVFATWSSGEEVTVRAVTVVAGGADLVVVPSERHDRLVVRRLDGTEVPVPEDRA